MGDKKQIVRVERELMTGVGPMAVLKLLEDREMYGYELVQALARESEGVLTMGEATLYPLLYNLETKKLIRGYVAGVPIGEETQVLLVDQER
jgi:DNA-binding PadR family transcriptional regulator